MLESILTILISTILVNNYVFAQFLGICPFLGVSSKTETALGMGIADLCSCTCICNNMANSNFCIRQIWT